jgi:hypothetical protein
MTTPATLAPRRDRSGRVLFDAPQREVHDQDELLALPPGVLPVLRGDAVFAVGAGALVLARDDVRVCGVEGAGIRASDRARIQVWEGAAVAGDGAVDITVGPGGRAWVVSDVARVTCRPAPSGVVIDEQTADLQAVVYGRSDVSVIGGQLTAGGGAQVTAAGRATLVLDRTVRGRNLDGRHVLTRGCPELAAPDLTAELTRHVGAAVWRPVAGDRLVLLPWLAPGAEATTLLEPVLEALAATGARRAGSWEPSAGGWTIDVRGRLDWQAVQARLAIPPAVSRWDGPNGPRILTDLGVEVRVLAGGLVSRAFR